MKKGFTLLELAIVITIIGVLTSVALPKLYSAIERSRSAEALAILSNLRGAMERCFLMNNGTYVGCRWDGWKQNIDIKSEPDPNQHFLYEVILGTVTRDSYTMRAVRNAYELSGGGGEIWCYQSPARFYCQGQGRYSYVQTGNPPP